MWYELAEPAHEAEILARSQLLVAGIHAEGGAERTGNVDSGLEFEGVKVTFVAHDLERIGLVDHILTGFGA